jgi:hypothetical protein
MIPAMRAWQCRVGPATHIALGDLHLEPLQVFYEYGILGLTAMALLAWEVGGALRWGDPWTAATLAGAAFACTTFSLRVAPLGALWLAIAAGVGR